MFSIKTSVVSILVVTLLPVHAFALTGGQRVVPTSKAKTYISPCMELTGVKQYRCRRFEAISHVRQVAEQQERVRWSRLQQQIGSSITSHNLGLGSSNVSLSKDDYLKAIKEKNPALYDEYVNGKTELIQARRAIRTLSRQPTETDLRKLLIKQKGDFINASRNDAVLRQTLLDDNVRLIRTFLPKK